MRILLSGGTGFLGAAVAEHFSGLGHDVHLLTRRPVEASVFPVVVFDGDVRSLARQMQNQSIEAVVHLASLFLSDHQPEQLDDLVQSNITLGLKLLEAMSLSGVRFFLNTGTSWQNHLNEDYHPVNLYSATKQAFEDLLRYYHEARGIQALTLRLFDTYGPADNRRKLFFLLGQAYLNGEVLQMSPGEQSIDLVHVDDVVQAYGQALVYLTNGALHPCEVFAVSSEHPLPLKTLVERYEAILGQKLAAFGGRPYRQREVMQTWSGYSLLPGWHARVSLEQGLQQMALKLKSSRT
ncbi:NAD-dependent epimerase/dehydratase family protein [Deinococcus cellulosilyticus]|uniref:Paratose synthase n=1 Tax=Deinococcus cellulosilyticus (strain DSM 18568 / NBRC 106333 / KACC 11606 / 5516J-15) TaxID=1223518 RepID=A0A511MXE8_DEIC1|nr:NAD(P)-dependent oxidoreductase [Deinococcus cellulosilyticus]GEM45264.1 paratose synthase [Deinococcus cellulosilyticus NBRC 106333 = KACC 11606]